MADAKIRVLAAERFLGAKKPRSGLPALDMEFCFLQIRRVIEDITFGGLVRERERYAALRGIEKAANPRDLGDPAKDWQAPEILKRLGSLSPHALPIPHKDGQRLANGVVHFDREKLEVSHARLIEMYKRCGGFLHSKNLIGEDFAADVAAQREKYVGAPDDVRRSLTFLRTLLWQHAALTLGDSAPDDPRTPASPNLAWLVNFGKSSGSEISITFAAAT
jgi:hypothetical protein